MNEPGARSLRNVAVIANRGAGKTSLAEAILLTTGGIPTLGSVMQGTTASDFEPEEIHHRCSVSTSLSAVPGITPPSICSIRPAALSLRRSDCGLAGRGCRDRRAQSGERHPKRAHPAVVAGEGARPAVPHLRQRTGKGIRIDGGVVGGLPSGFGPHAVADVVPAQRRGAVGGRPGFEPGGSAFPGRHREVAAAAGAAWRRGHAGRRAQADSGGGRRVRRSIVGTVPLRCRTLAGGRVEGLRTGVQAGTIVPLYTGSALKNIGTVPLLNAIVDLLPSPADRAQRRPLTGQEADGGHEVTRAATAEAPFSAVIFKTIIDPFVGRLSYVRVASGALQADSLLYNGTRKLKEKSGHVSVAGQEAHGRRHGGRRRYRGDRQTQGCADRRHAL